MAKLLSSFVAAASLLALVGGNATARDRAAAFMPTAGLTSQPIGHYELCQAMPGECTMVTDDAGAVALTDRRWRELTAVNDSVNRAIRPVTDQELFGRPEVWFYPTDAGDCEDYVLLKRRTLMRRGWPAGALLVTVVRRPDGEGHAVLTVRTDRGDLVLDNLRPDIRVWSDTEYAFVKRQSERDSGRWVAIQDERSDLVGAVGR